MRCTKPQHTPQHDTLRHTPHNSAPHRNTRAAHQLPTYSFLLSTIPCTQYSSTFKPHDNKMAKNDGAAYKCCNGLLLKSSDDSPPSIQSMPRFYRVRVVFCGVCAVCKLFGRVSSVSFNVIYNRTILTHTHSHICRVVAFK